MDSEHVTEAWLPGSSGETFGLHGIDFDFIKYGMAKWTQCRYVLVFGRPYC